MHIVIPLLAVLAAVTPLVLGILDSVNKYMDNRTNRKIRSRRK